MNKLIGIIRVLLIGIGCIVLCAMWCIIQEQKAEIQKPKIIEIQDPNFIPSAREIQQRLKETNKPRYDPGKIDGIIGRKSKIAWNNYTCDQYAIQTFKPEYLQVRKAEKK